MSSYSSDISLDIELVQNREVEPSGVAELHRILEASPPDISGPWWCRYAEIILICSALLVLIVFGVLFGYVLDASEKNLIVAGIFGASAWLAIFLPAAYHVDRYRAERASLPKYSPHIPTTELHDPFLRQQRLLDPKHVPQYRIVPEPTGQGTRITLEREFRGLVSTVDQAVFLLDNGDGVAQAAEYQCALEDQLQEIQHKEWMRCVQQWIEADEQQQRTEMSEHFQAALPTPRDAKTLVLERASD